MHTKLFLSTFLSKVVLLAILTVPMLCHGAGLTIQPGAGISINGGGINLGCTDLVINGDLNLGSGYISETADIILSGGSLDAGTGTVILSGDWTNNGTFTSSASQVNIVDGCSSPSSLISGDNNFYSFSASSATGKELQLTAASKQVFANALSLQGATGMPLLIRSTSPGAQAFFELMPLATQNIAYVDVQDNNALAGSLLAPGLPAVSNSVDSGNNLNWFHRPFSNIPIPTLSLPALLLLILAMLLVAFRSLPIFINTDR